MKIAHFSDLHYSNKHLAEADRCFTWAVERAIALGVDAAVISGDSTDHALDVHSPAVERLARNVRCLADHCPVLMLQGTYSHEPPGTLSIFRLLGGRFGVHVADRIEQVALDSQRRWSASPTWRFEALPNDLQALFTCVPTVNKGVVASAVGATEAAGAVGEELASLLRGFASIHRAAHALGAPTIGVSHGTVFGCITEHGVPMAGFDHEFTTGSLFGAGARAFMLGHIHRHQAWECDGQTIAYAGSIGRFHYGEEGEKGFLLWDVDAAGARFQLVATPARTTIDIVFEGKPDLDRIMAVAAEHELQGAYVRVRWTIADEDRHEVDRAAIERVLRQAAEVKLEGRIVPVTRTRADGISRARSVADKVATWARVTQARAQPLLDRLGQLEFRTPEEIAEALIAAAAESASRGDGASGETVAIADEPQAGTEPVRVIESFASTAQV
jgi:exonuclease SbcD